MTAENINSNSSTNDYNFAIRFGLGAIKAVGLKMMENAVEERKKNGKFIDIFDFCFRLDPKAINKKSIEALAKSGTFDSISQNRQQIAESFDILSAYAHQLNDAKTSNQMSLFGSATQSIPKPNLKKISQPWSNIEILQKEFESFGFFLNQHPLDENISNLKKRGVIFSNYIDNEELEDNSIVKMAGVILSSKHRSSARGRFAYINISDPFGIYEVTIFDEALITNSRDLLQDGSVIVIECLIRKDVGGSRIMIKAVSQLSDFIANNKPSENDFADIKKIKIRKNNFEKNNVNNNKPNNSNNYKSAQTPSKSDSNHPTSSTQKLQNVENNQKKIKSLSLTINNKSFIEPLKIILNQKISSEDNEPKTQIFLIAKDKSKSTKIQLPPIYKIQEIDVIRFKNFNQNLEVEVEYL